MATLLWYWPPLRAVVASTDSQLLWLSTGLFGTSSSLCFQFAWGVLQRILSKKSIRGPKLRWRWLLKTTPQTEIGIWEVYQFLLISIANVCRVYFTLQIGASNNWDNGSCRICSTEYLTKDGELAGRITDKPVLTGTRTRRKKISNSSPKFVKSHTKEELALPILHFKVDENSPSLQPDAECGEAFLLGWLTETRTGNYGKNGSTTYIFQKKPALLLATKQHQYQLCWQLAGTGSRTSAQLRNCHRAEELPLRTG